MATKLYLHDAATTVTGTLPSMPPSGYTNSLTGATSATRTMDTTIGASQASMSGTSINTTALQDWFCGQWCSPPLQGAQTVGGGTITFNGADSESNTNANFWWKGGRLWVWRPSTNSLVGTVNVGFLVGSEPSSASTEQVSRGTSTSSGISAADGDVVIFQSVMGFTQSMGTAYTITIYYDGTTENDVENTTVSNHASFIQLNENLVFKTPGSTPKSYGFIIGG